TDSAGNPITSTQTVTFQVLYGTCILLEETQSITPGTFGEFSVIVGTGFRVDSTGNTGDRIFGSSGTVNCSGSSAVSLTGFATRSLHIIVGGVDLSPDVTIGNIPMAINSQKLADKGLADLVLINNTAGVTQPNIESLFARFSDLNNLLNAYTGNSLAAQSAQTAVNFSGVLAGDITGTQGATAVSKLQGKNVNAANPTNGQVLTFVSNEWVPSTLPTGGTISALTGDISASGSGSVSAIVNSVSGSSGANIHSAEIAANAATNANTASTIVKRDASGNFTAGTITANLMGAASSNVLKSGDTMSGNLTFASTSGTVYTDTTSKTVGLFAPTTIGTSYTLKLPASVAASNGQVLTSDTSGNLTWTTPSTTATSYAGVLPVANGGTNSAAALYNNRIMVSNGGAIVESAALTNGQVLIGSDGAAPTPATLTAGSGVTITNSAGGITIAATGSGGTVTNVTGTAPVSVATGTSTPVISLANGSAAGQVYRWDGTSSWAATKLKYTDLINSFSGNPWPGTSCAAGQAVVWNSGTDSFTCSNIVANVSGNSSLTTGKFWVGDGSGKAAEVSLSGDATIASTGALTLASVGTSGTYKSVTVDSKGRVLSGTNPTTVSGYGITDAAVLGGVPGGQILEGGVASGENLILDSTANVTKGNVLINPSGGKVGIGTATPTASLTIQAPASSFGQLQIKDSSFAASSVSHRSYIQALDNASSTVWYLGDTNPSTQDISFGTSAIGYGLNLDTNGMTRFRVQPDGSIGINTMTANLTGTGPGPGTVTISGSGASSTDTGYLEFNNPMTPALGNISGKISFNSSLNSGSKTLASLQSTISGSGGTNGFGGQLIFSTKQDNSVSINLMVMNNLGNLGVGLNPAYKLDVNGDANLSTGSVFRIAGTQICGGAGCTSSSDRRLKENIQPLTNSLEKILQLNAVEYDYKDKVRFGDKHQIGVIAQDVEKVFPEVVITDRKTTLKSVAYDHLVAPIIESIKALYGLLIKIEDQQHSQARQIASKAEQTEIEALKAENTAKTQRIQSLEQENILIKARLEKIEKSLQSK
ncbi:MAG: tail fiber domain-containing protein, partial [Bacillota bacterium]